jgi:RHS repeat-associated protein
MGADDLAGLIRRAQWTPRAAFPPSSRLDEELFTLGGGLYLMTNPNFGEGDPVRAVGWAESDYWARRCWTIPFKDELAPPPPQWGPPPSLQFTGRPASLAFGAVRAWERAQPGALAPILVSARYRISIDGAFLYVKIAGAGGVTFFYPSTRRSPSGSGCRSAGGEAGDASPRGPVPQRGVVGKSGLNRRDRGVASGAGRPADAASSRHGAPAAARCRSTAWGEPVAGAARASEPCGFTGALERADGSPPCAMGARMYAPSAGAFTSMDSHAGAAAAPASMNRFLCAGGDPASLVDPAGHTAILVDEAGDTVVRVGSYVSKSTKPGQSAERVTASLAGQRRVTQAATDARNALRTGYQTDASQSLPAPPTKPVEYTLADPTTSTTAPAVSDGVCKQGLCMTFQQWAAHDELQACLQAPACKSALEDETKKIQYLEDLTAACKTLPSMLCDMTDPSTWDTAVYSCNAMVKNPPMLGLAGIEEVPEEVASVLGGDSIAATAAAAGVDVDTLVDAASGGAGSVQFGPVPTKAMDTFLTVQQTGTAPAGFYGGKIFKNLGLKGGQVLPRTAADGSAITYREWDVNPFVSHALRGTERIVTGTDGSAYYTSNHYDTFVQFWGLGQ